VGPQGPRGEIEWQRQHAIGVRFRRGDLGGFAGGGEAVTSLSSAVNPSLGWRLLREVLGTVCNDVQAAVRLARELSCSVGVARVRFVPTVWMLTIRLHRPDRCSPSNIRLIESVPRDFSGMVRDRGGTQVGPVYGARIGERVRRRCALTRFRTHPRELRALRGGLCSASTRCRRWWCRVLAARWVATVLGSGSVVGMGVRSSSRYSGSTSPRCLRGGLTLSADGPT